MPTSTLRRQPDQARRFRLGEWMSAPEWISVKEASELSGYNLKYLRRVIQNGKIAAEKKGGREWWIDKASLQAYVKQMKQLGSDKYNPYRDKD